jgi:hypothetical protein
VLERTVQALNDDDLPAARRIFRELPKVRNESREVAAVRNRLHEAIESKVKKLTSEGDKRYRADNVNMAIRSWERRELDPATRSSLSTGRARRYWRASRLRADRRTNKAT